MENPIEIKTYQYNCLPEYYNPIIDSTNTRNISKHNVTCQKNRLKRKKRRKNS